MLFGCFLSFLFFNEHLCAQSFYSPFAFLSKNIAVVFPVLQYIWSLNCQLLTKLMDLVLVLDHPLLQFLFSLSWQARMKNCFGFHFTLLLQFYFCLSTVQQYFQKLENKHCLLSSGDLFWVAFASCTLMYDCGASSISTCVQCNRAVWNLRKLENKHCLLFSENLFWVVFASCTLICHCSANYIRSSPTTRW